jgi:cell wall-associated NlpC family hydrolase
VTKRAAISTVVVLATAFMAGTAAAAPPSAAKRAEAQQVLEQIHQLDLQVEQAIEEYNAAKIELDAIHKEQADNQRHLALAKASFRKAQRSLQGRLLALYTGGETSTLEILLGATSLSDFLSRTDTVSRVSKQDLRIVREIQAAKDEMRLREAALKKAQARQTIVVADLSAQKASIQGQLAQRRQLLSTIKSQIAAIEAAEAKRQARLKELAEQRLQNPAPSAPSGPPETFVDGAAPPPTQGGVVGIAMRYLGVPYVWGGASPSGFDCSGFSMYVYAQVGISLPHNAAMQYGYGSPVSRAQLAPGDLVFFNGLGHMGIYIGGGQFIHAPHTGDVVKISSLNESWYSSTYYGARRL